MAYHLAQEWLTLNTSVSFMGSSSNVFMRWRGVILEVFMYLFNKRRRTIFGEYEVHKQEVLGISLFLWAAPSYLRGRSCKRDLLTRPHPNLTPQSWGMHSHASHSAWGLWPGQGHSKEPQQWVTQKLATSFSHPGPNWAMQRAITPNKHMQSYSCLSHLTFSVLPQLELVTGKFSLHKASDAGGDPFSVVNIVLRGM